MSAPCWMSRQSLSVAPGPVALLPRLGAVGCELQREVLRSCNALFLEGGFVAIVWHDDRERHRFRGAAELNDDVDQRLGPSWIRAITDHLRVDLHRHYAASYALKGDRPQSHGPPRVVGCQCNGKGDHRCDRPCREAMRPPSSFRGRQGYCPLPTRRSRRAASAYWGLWV